MPLFFCLHTASLKFLFHSFFLLHISGFGIWKSCSFIIFLDSSLQVGAEGGGPRQPWHDWHCKIDGPAAYDVLTNFEQRWRKAARWHEDELIQIERISWILGPKPPFPAEGDPKLYVTKDDDPSTWRCQVSLQSIESFFL